jgi:hypothetical protein
MASSRVSIRCWQAKTHAGKSFAGGVIVFGGLGKGLEDAVFQDLDLLLGVGKLGAAILQQFGAALVSAERRFQAE